MYMKHMTISSDNSEYSQPSGQRSGMQRAKGQPSGAQRSGAQAKAGLAVSWFGVPLAEQPTEVDRVAEWRSERKVPKLLAALRRALDESDGMQEEGIFRTAEAAGKLSFIRKRLESGEDPDAVLEGCSCHAVSTLIKAWFAELPGGVMWTGGDAAAAKAKKSSKKGAQAADAGRELERELIAAAKVGMPIKMILKNAMPETQRDTLYWLLDLLCEAATQQSTSKMGADNLAVIFAPVLLPTDASAPPMEQLQRAKDGVTLVKSLLVTHEKDRPKPAASDLAEGDESATGIDTNGDGAVGEVPPAA